MDFFSFGFIPFTDANIWTTALAIFFSLTAAAVAVLFLLLIMPEKKRKRQNKFFGFISDFLNFKKSYIEKLLKAFYIFTTVFSILMGLVEIWFDFVGGFFAILIAPFALRVVYELVMLLVKHVRNTQDIRDKLCGADKVEEPAEPVEPRIVFCSKCGTRYDANQGGCPNGCEQ
ncbi:MAG: hypothetical protein ILO53_06090 [Clostridia bacterium]|nr:hypothetical protein [Clostridia bacterium]